MFAPWLFSRSLPCRFPPSAYQLLASLPASPPTKYLTDISSLRNWIPRGGNFWQNRNKTRNNRCANWDKNMKHLRVVPTHFRTLRTLSIFLSLSFLEHIFLSNAECRPLSGIRRQLLVEIQTVDSLWSKFSSTLISLLLFCFNPADPSAIFLISLHSPGDSLLMLPIAVQMLCAGNAFRKQVTRSSAENDTPDTSAGVL